MLNNIEIKKKYEAIRYLCFHLNIYFQGYSSFKINDYLFMLKEAYGDCPEFKELESCETIEETFEKALEIFTLDKMNDDIIYLLNQNSCYDKMDKDNSLTDSLNLHM